MAREYQYNEGEKASGNFEKAIKTIFKAPKKKTGKQPVKAASAKKNDSSDSG